MALTLEAMRDLLRQGESVLIGVGQHRRIISREEDLPSAVELDADEAAGAMPAVPPPLPTIEPSAATLEAQRACAEAERAVRAVERRQNELPALYAAAVEAADPGRMRELGRAIDDLAQDLAAAKIVAARARVAVLQAQSQDAARRVGQAKERRAAAEAVHEIARAAFEEAETAVRTAWAEDAWAVHSAGLTEAQVIAARQAVDQLIASTSARVQ